MKVDQADTFAKATERLGQLICEHLVDYPLGDLMLDAQPVRRQSDAKIIATVLVAYPRGHAERSVLCMYPRVRELV